MTDRTKTVVGILCGAYLLGMGMLAGVVLERMRFDRQRSDVLGRDEQVLREWRTYRMALETTTGGQR